MNATNATSEAPRQGAGETAPPNRLYYGDCLTIMQDMPAGSVDLIYLDPPFNSNRAYNAIYRDETGRPLPDQIEAFCDLWELNIERERAVRNLPAAMRAAGIDDAGAESWRSCAIGLRGRNPRLLAYLSYMVERLIVMRDLLKPTGSIFLHCDPTASHYIKIMLDVIFGERNFRNEIVWAYRTGGVSNKWFARKHDIIFFYTRSPGRKHTFNVLKERSYSSNAPPGFRGIQVFRDDDGRPYTLASMRDVWQVDAVGRTSGERIGYATQKPLALMDRIIRAGSNPGDLVLDPFCGCATTIEAAHRLGRRWIGVDIAIHAITRVSRVRLQDRCGLVEGRDYLITGQPRNLEGAQDLWQRDTYQFQKWAVEQVDGFVTSRRAADGGIDGRLYFAIPNAPDLQSMVIEVKGGARTTIRDVRALHSVLERDQALLAGLIVMNPPGARQRANFEREMAQAGDLEIMGARYPRMQLLTVGEILDGRRFNTPGVAGRRLPQPVLPLG